MKSEANILHRLKIILVKAQYTSLSTYRMEKNDGSLGLCGKACCAELFKRRGSGMTP
ncbi:hypothetical protein D3OALGA1CA_4560 [Olavius algarvensis associated proteobacterium Delta 3]|nr:hypothetical protein D3OALGB2SA_3044 [Olavius algarvensis associated proteobacterium Delta 3]CAB5153353.1 hypothetical protein D3OALGA1CA_4560 [Olavius algarvensis associated proteobacterium Delta 3]